MSEFIFVLVHIRLYPDQHARIESSVLASDDIDKLWDKVEHPSWYKNPAGVWCTEIVNDQMNRIDKIPKI